MSKRMQVGTGLSDGWRDNSESSKHRTPAVPDSFSFPFRPFAEKNSFNAGIQYKKEFQSKGKVAAGVTTLKGNNVWVRNGLKKIKLFFVT